MSILLIRLNDAPEDEVQDLRELLARHRIDFYETHAGRWGFSVAGIWLREDSRVEEARRLVAEYQRDRSEQARRQYELERREGRHETLVDRLRRHPLQHLFYLLAVLAVLYLSIMPFVAEW